MGRRGCGRKDESDARFEQSEEMQEVVELGEVLGDELLVAGLSPCSR